MQSLPFHPNTETHDQARIQHNIHEAKTKNGIAKNCVYVAKIVNVNSNNELFTWQTWIFKKKKKVVCAQHHIYQDLRIICNKIAFATFGSVINGQHFSRHGEVISIS